MVARSSIQFTDNPAILDQSGKYVTLFVDTDKILKSYKQSLFSFEWLGPDGKIKKSGELPAQERQKRLRVESKIAAGKAIEKPVLGIGLMENIEFGIGRAEFLTLAAYGLQTIEVHVPKQSESDFNAYRAQVE